MEQAIELLKRWAELEPEHCEEKTVGTVIGFVFPDAEDGYEASAEMAPDMYDFNLGIVQRQVQRAIIARNLLYELANDQQGTHHAQILNPADNSGAVGNDPEPALALLRAYVCWLEKVPVGGQAA